MTLQKAIDVTTEMQKWRRSEPPYDEYSPEQFREMPYSPKEFGEAIDVLRMSAINKLKSMGKK